MENDIEKRLNIFLDNPVELNAGIVLTNEDIESVVSEKDFPKSTMRFLSKDGYATYSLDTQTRMIVVVLPESFKWLGFILKPDSKLLSDYINNYER